MNFTDQFLTMCGKAHYEGVSVAPHCRCLAVLVKHGPQRMGDLAALLNIMSASMTELADTLEKMGLIKRILGIVDRRTISIEITPKGKDLIERIMKP